MKKLWKWLISLFKRNHKTEIPYEQIKEKLIQKTNWRYFDPKGGKGYYRKVPTIH